MNYFDGIKSIRDEQNAYYAQLLKAEADKTNLTSQIVQLTRQKLASKIQSQYYGVMSPRRKGKKKVSLKSRQHDEYAILNYYDK